MKSVTKPLLVFCSMVAAVTLVTGFAAAGADNLRENVLRNAAKRAGLVPVEQTYVPIDPKLAEVGKLIFQSKKLSLDHETACASCHLDRFGSSDGLPNAIGTRGRGEGMDRLASGGDIIPRNTLPFWGVGGVGYNVLFWDGKVDGSSGTIVSQFGDSPPADDPLVVAVHIPPVEIREMITDSQANDVLETESLDTAADVYGRLTLQLTDDEEILEGLARVTGKAKESIRFLDIAKSVAAFIRQNFRLKQTRLHQFVFGSGALTDQEIAGGLIFYGKGRCAICHNGPYFSDMKFHAVPFPEAGFGKNGFGVDYGRFNVTMNPNDRYKFRTPPLFNVSKTAPYSHSGSIANLQDAILAHVDPFAVFDPSRLPGIQRADYYQSIKAWAQEPLIGLTLDDVEISALRAFLETLEFESDTRVSVSE